MLPDRLSRLRVGRRTRRTNIPRHRGVGYIVKGVIWRAVNVSCACAQKNSRTSLVDRVAFYGVVVSRPTAGVVDVHAGFAAAIDEIRLDRVAIAADVNRIVEL